MIFCIWQNSTNQNIIHNETHFKALTFRESLDEESILKIHTSMHTKCSGLSRAALFNNSEKQLKGLKIREWLAPIWYMHLTGIYRTITTNGLCSY